MWKSRATAAGSLRHCFSLCASSPLCALCSALCIVLCVLCFVLCVLPCTLCKCALRIVHCALCSALCNCMVPCALCSVPCPVHCVLCVFLGDSKFSSCTEMLTACCSAPAPLQSLFQIFSVVFCACLLLSSITCTMCNLFLVQPRISSRLSVFLCASYSAQRLSHCW